MKKRKTILIEKLNQIITSNRKDLLTHPPLIPPSLAREGGWGVEGSKDFLVAKIISF